MIRSALYTPGNISKMLAKVGTFGADAVVLDLEDAVPAREKVAARKMVREALPKIQGPLRFVRVNPSMTGLMEDDISEVFCPKLDGIYLPKVESVEELKTADALLSELEGRFKLPDQGVEIHPIIESARGIMKIYPILEESPARVRKCGFGAGDLMTDLGIRAVPGIWESSDLNFLYPRSHLVLASRAAGKEPPLDCVYGDIRDLAGLEKQALLAKRLGFQGKTAIHPSQVEVINRVFTPSKEEIEFAQKVVNAFEEAESAGSASFTLNGAFVDIGVVKNAESILKRFGRQEEF